MGYLVFFSARVHGVVQADVCHRSLQAAVVFLLIYGWGLPKPKIYWGIPLYLSRVLLLFDPYPHTVQLASSYLCFTLIGSGGRSVQLQSSPSILTTDDYGSPHINRCRRLKSLCPQCSSSIASASMSDKLSHPTTLFSPDLRRPSLIRHRDFTRSVVVPPLRGESVSLYGLRGPFVLMGLVDSNLSLSLPLSLSTPQPIILWGNLALLVKFLMIIDGFIGITTEAEVLILLYSSCEKSSILPVDSPEPSSLPLPESFSPKKRTVSFLVSPMGSVSSPNIKWSYLSTSITDLLSCVAVRSEPEDVTEFVSMIFRGADWILTSQFIVTNFQPSGSAVHRFLTHSSYALNSLSFYLRGFSTHILYVVFLYVVSDTNYPCIPRSKIK